MTDYERIEKIIQFLMAHQEQQPSLETLANAAGLSKFHFHRLFSRWAGVTPKMFLKFITANYAKSLLNGSNNVLDVSLQVGLSGPGRLHDLFVTIDGMTPGEFKSKGKGIEIRYGFHITPFGWGLIGLTSRGICHLSFLAKTERASSLKQLRRNWPQAKFIQDQRATAAMIQRIFKKPSEKEKIKIFLMGTPFQLKVWEALLQITSGKVSSYGAIAQSIGIPKASRAVGTAVSHNPVAFLIPCHRVIRRTGVIGQYRGGPSRKRALLCWEQAISVKDTIE